MSDTAAQYTHISCILYCRITN